MAEPHASPLLCVLGVGNSVSSLDTWLVNGIVFDGVVEDADSPLACLSSLAPLIQQRVSPGVVIVRAVTALRGATGWVEEVPEIGIAANGIKIFILQRGVAVARS